MRVIPVIDLMHNQTVHAVKGERDHYKPIESILCNSSDPLEVAAAFNNLGLNEIYIADLDAICNQTQTSHRPIIEKLASDENCDVILDAGIFDIEGICQWLERGVHKVVIGSETLTSLEVLNKFVTGTDPDRIVFSLDCYNGKILSKCPELAELSPVKALESIHSAGLREIILLDLARVGSSYGINRSFASEVRADFPDMTLLVGGGITGLAEIKELKSLGIEGVLLATVLHQGIIGSEHLSGLNIQPRKTHHKDAEKNLISKAHGLKDAKIP